MSTLTTTLDQFFSESSFEPHLTAVDALLSVTEATVTNADRAEQHLCQGLTELQHGDLPRAYDQFRSATRLAPQSAEAWNNCGMVLLAMGQAVDAVAQFTRAIELSPNYAEAWNNRARARQTLTDLEGAGQDFDTALKFATGQFAATVYHNRGSLKQHCGELTAAHADFDRALAIDPELLVSLLNRAALLKAEGHYESALADLDLALTLATPTDAAAIYHARGGVLVLQDKFDTAIEDYDRALQISPDDVVAYVSRGNARYHRRDLRSVSDYLAAFRLNPSLAAREMVRVLLQGVREDAEAVLANCDKHLRIQERDAVAHGRRALTLALLGRRDEALPHISRFEQLVPEGARYFQYLLDAASSKMTLS